MMLTSSCPTMMASAGGHVVGEGLAAEPLEVPHGPTLATPVMIGVSTMGTISILKRQKMSAANEKGTTARARALSGRGHCQRHRARRGPPPRCRRAVPGVRAENLAVREVLDDPVREVRVAPQVDALFGLRPLEITAASNCWPGASLPSPRGCPSLPP